MSVRRTFRSNLANALGAYGFDLVDAELDRSGRNAGVWSVVYSDGKRTRRRSLNLKAGMAPYAEDTAARIAVTFLV